MGKILEYPYKASINDRDQSVWSLEIIYWDCTNTVTSVLAMYAWKKLPLKIEIPANDFSEGNNNR